MRAALDLLDPLLPRNRLLFNLVDDVVIIAALACLLLAVMALVAHWRETPEWT